MIEWAKACVEGGIPLHGSTPVKRTLTPIAGDTDLSDNIQSAIDDVAADGGGVILLEAGDYPIQNSIDLKSDVILRGADRNTVRIISRLRASSSSKKNSVSMKDISGAGIEDLTLYFDANGVEPIDRDNLTDGGWCGDCFENDPNGVDNLYVRLLYIANSTNCWLDHCRILESGTDPVYLQGTHLTSRNNFIDRSYNKGGSGNGYFDIRGSHCLIVQDTVKRIRHVAVQQGAEYTVLYKCHIEVDVNFHNKDNGHNLVEQHTILQPTWHGWDIFSTGGASYGHTPPGPDNLPFNNTTDYKKQGPRYAEQDVVYTFLDYGDPTESNLPTPSEGTLYAVKRTTTRNKQFDISNTKRISRQSKQTKIVAGIDCSPKAAYQKRMYTILGRPQILTKDNMYIPGVYFAFDNIQQQPTNYQQLSLVNSDIYTFIIFTCGDDRRRQTRSMHPSNKKGKKCRSRTAQHKMLIIPASFGPQ
ncbi:MAG: hypothetical protein GF401_02880 [Chitinivibrionales bacterium]|nr:hypothetical protein [Chitinivibrionales bacterium]